MFPEITGSAVLVEDIKGEETFIMGPYDTDEEMEGAISDLLHIFRPEDKHVKGIELESLQDDNLLEYNEAYFLAINLQGEVTMVVWDLDHRE